MSYILNLLTRSKKSAKHYIILNIGKLTERVSVEEWSYKGFSGMKWT